MGGQGPGGAAGQVEHGLAVRGAVQGLVDDRQQPLVLGEERLLLVELLGPGRILGNHVVLDLGDEVYAALAHLRRGSVRVRPGDRVAAGQQLAACGNSGNSTEPHLHFQLMDHPSLHLGDLAHALLHEQKGQNGTIRLG